MSKVKYPPMYETWGDFVCTVCGEERVETPAIVVLGRWCGACRKIVKFKLVREHPKKAKP